MTRQFFDLSKNWLAKAKLGALNVKTIGGSPALL
jgi:hypothetical protein